MPGREELVCSGNVAYDAPVRNQVRRVPATDVSRTRMYCNVSNVENGFMLTVEMNNSGTGIHSNTTYVASDIDDACQILRDNFNRLCMD